MGFGFHQKQDNTLISLRSVSLNYSIQIYSPQALHYFGNLCVHQKPLNVNNVWFNTVIIWLHTSAVLTNLAGSQ